MKKLLIIIGILFVLVILIGGIFVFMNMSSGRSPSTTSSTSNFPITGSNSGGTGSAAVSGSGIAVTSESGTPITTKDFIHNGTTIEDPENKGSYYLAGSVGYCLPDGSCPSGATSTDYSIVYYAQDKGFTIGLASEPIGQARSEAEQFLMKTLGLTEAQMCDLKYQVLTSIDVNGEFAGENLGFSFCPGAVKLPS